MVARSDLARDLDFAHDVERLAVDHDDGLAAADIEELLLRIGRQGEIARERRRGVDQLLDELAVAREHLHAAVLAVGEVHHAVVGDADGVRDVEMRQTLAIGKRLGADDRATVLAAGRLAEGAPGPLERAGVGVEHDDAVIAIAVGHEQLVGARQHPRIRGAMQVRGVGVAFALVALADLQDELAVGVNFRSASSATGFRPADAGGRALVAADPGEALVVDVDAVLALGPLVAVARAAPGLDEIPGGIEHHDRRRSLGGVLGLQRARTVQHVDVVLRVDGDAGGVAEFPLRRHLGPGRIDREGRNGTDLLRLRARVRGDEASGSGHDRGERHDCGEARLGVMASSPVADALVGPALAA